MKNPKVNDTVLLKEIGEVEILKNKDGLFDYINTGSGEPTLYVNDAQKATFGTVITVLSVREKFFWGLANDGMIYAYLNSSIKRILQK